jgi:hypothetical protein
MTKQKLQFFQGAKATFVQSGSSLVHLTAVVGLIIGALAVAALNPDSSRHYLWAVFLIKLIIFKWFYDSAVRLSGVKIASTLVVIAALLASWWFANLVKYNWNTDDAIKKRDFTVAIHDIKTISERTGIKHIYGENFWRMMPLNTLIEGMNSQALLYGSGELHPYSWLTRPSWSCVEGDVLYYLKDGPVDKVIQEKLIYAKGNKIKDGNGYAIWVGPRVWRLPSNASCHESSLIIRREFVRKPASHGWYFKR